MLGSETLALSFRRCPLSKYKSPELFLLSGKTTSAETSIVAFIATLSVHIFSDSKVLGANMGPIWGRQDPGGPIVGPMNFAILVFHSTRNKLPLRIRVKTSYDEI